MRSNLGLRPWSGLRIGSDHGISLSGNPSREEMESTSDIFVTWSAWRANLSFPDKKKVVRVQHPWIPYRKKAGFLLSASASGTLAFLPHSVPGLAHENFDLPSYIDSVLALPKKFHPVVFCVHSHDVSQELIDKISASGSQAETVGNSLHPAYVKRFYKLVSHFEYATSPTVGSQLFYCEEFGLKYFLYATEEKHQKRLISAEINSPSKARLLELESLFSFENLGKKKHEKKTAVSDALGLDLGRESDFGYSTLHQAIREKHNHNV